MNALYYENSTVLSATNKFFERKCEINIRCFAGWDGNVDVVVVAAD